VTDSIPSQVTSHIGGVICNYEGLQSRMQATEGAVGQGFKANAGQLLSKSRDIDLVR
jgi:hypothetical protein